MIDMRGRYSFPALCISLFLAGCASQPKSYVVLLENPDQTAGTIIVKGPKGEHVVNMARHGLPLDGSTSPQRIDEAKLQKDFAEAFSATPPLPVHFLLYFDKGGAKLLPESEALLDKIVTLSATRTAIDLSVIGHTDTEDAPEQGAQDASTGHRVARRA
jgi:adhesin transport system outer membrane protein